MLSLWPGSLMLAGSLSGSGLRPEQAADAQAAARRGGAEEDPPARHGY